MPRADEDQQESDDRTDDEVEGADRAEDGMDDSVPDCVFDQTPLMSANYSGLPLLARDGANLQRAWVVDGFPDKRGSAVMARMIQQMPSYVNHAALYHAALGPNAVLANIDISGGVKRRCAATGLTGSLLLLPDGLV